jgi:BirA family biotin operon repressor/biotin-[acetyl-CoA-carboxylase] ligase
VRHLARAGGDGLSAAEAAPPERLAGLLAAAGAPWPAPIEHHAWLASTSDRLKQWARAGAAPWSVVFADRQSAGRGRLGHAWESPPGNAFVSVLLPPLPADRAPALPLAAGLAVAEGLEAHGVAPLLKWPNDVLVGERKIAGILAEGLASGAELEAVVLGVGVNVRLDPGTLPAPLAAAATSLRVETGQDADVIAVIASVLGRLTVWYHALAVRGSAAVVAAWRARALPWWGRVVEARSGHELLRGVALGVDERGALLIEREDGIRLTVLSAEVRELRAR